MTLNRDQYFVDRDNERALFAGILAGEIPERVMLVLADGEEGKTCFLQRLQQDCLDNNTPVIKLDFDTRRSGLTDWLGVARQVRRALRTKKAPHIDACDTEIRSAAQGIDLSKRFADVMGQAMLQDLAEYGRDATSPPQDMFTPYEIGITELLNHLPRNHTNYRDALAYQHRLLENIQRVRRLGPTREQDAERTDIMINLRTLVWDVLHIDFDTLCRTVAPDKADTCAPKVIPQLTVLIDTFERASIEARVWLERWLFEPLCDDLLHIAVVVAGRTSCNEFFDAAQRWGELIQPTNFEPLSDTHIQTYYRLRELSISDLELPVIMKMARLGPAKMAQLGDMLAQARGGD